VEPKEEVVVIRTYYVEFVYTVVLMLYALNYLLGRHTNQQIATAWGKQFRELFENNFSKVGEAAVLTKQSQNSFQLMATGRRNCVGCQATLQLVKRHDLLSLLLRLFIPVQDTLIIEVPMNAESMDALIFAIVHEKQEKQFRQENDDISLYASKVSLQTEDVLPNSLTILTDCEDLVPVFVHEQVSSTITKYLEYFVSLHFTDQAPSVHYKKMLRFVYKLPPADQMDKLSTLMRMALYFVDTVAQTRLSVQAKSRAEKQRTKAAEAAQKATHGQRQEAAQQRKLAKKQKEQANLSKDQQRKQQLRDQKKALKKRQPKFKVVYG